jgi:CRP-like cAMP-binding protein
MTTPRKAEVLILGALALAGLVWMVATNHFDGLELEFKLDYLIDLSSLFTVASFSARGMLPLRLLAVASSIAAIPYFLLQPTPLWTPVGWTVLFMLINLYHVVRILLERRPVRLTPDEQQLYDLAFTRLTPREFLKLVRFGEWQTAQAHEHLCEKDQRIERVVVLVSGAATASLDDTELLRLQPGQLIGEGIALAPRSSLYSAEFSEASRFMSWPAEGIDQFRRAHPELRIKFDDIINHHLVQQINALALSLVHRSA